VKKSHVAVVLHRVKKQWLTTAVRGLGGLPGASTEQGLREIV